ncbi:MAG: hypothetical protein U0694_06760 [Anaerolineae bacterium]
MTQPPPKPPAFLAWIVAFAVISGALLLLALLPTGEGAALLVIAALLGMFAAAVRAGASPVRVFRRGWRWLLKERPIAADRPFALGDALRSGQAFVEIVIMIGLALYCTRDFLMSDDGFRLPGYESEWLTNSAFLASLTLHEHGYLPLWQPYMEFGEPLVHNPFGFILNPFSSVPSLIWGGQHGVKISVTLTAIIAGIGGWFLGRVLGFSAWGRLLLGALMLGKGNMHAMLGNGYFQLGVAQAYFPWVIGGALATLRLPGKRWPVALTALSFTLMFFAGNLWYTLPMVITLALLTLTHLFHTRHPRVDWGALRRLALAGLFTVALCMVVLLPLWSERNLIGGHPDDITAGEEMSIPLRRAMFQAFDFTPQWAWKDTVNYGELPLPADQFLYSYVSPAWFAILIFIVLPPLYPLLHRPAARQSWRIWLAALPLIVFFAAWGAGNTPFFIWLYNTIPGLAQWRFVGRAFAMSSFWIGVLVAWRFDALLRAVIYDVNLMGARYVLPLFSRIPVLLRDLLAMIVGGVLGGGAGFILFLLWSQFSGQGWFWSFEGRIVASLGFVIGVLTAYLLRVRQVSGRGQPNWALSVYMFPALLLISTGAVAGWDVAKRWQEFALPSLIYDEQIHDIACVRWLREQYPNRPLAIWRQGYEIVNEFLTQHVRLSNIASDYIPIEEPPTVGGVIEFPDRLLAEFAVPGYPNERAFLVDQGYRLVIDSPRHPDGVPCLYRNPQVLPYAFMLPLRYAEVYPEVPLLNSVTPIAAVEQYPGVVLVAVQGSTDEEMLVTVQERAYPGWSVRLDERDAPLESYLGQLGVVIPADGQMHLLTFEYRPPLLMLGGLITLLASLVLALYLLWPARK